MNLLQLPKNLKILAVTLPLGTSVIPLVMLVGTLQGARIAPTPSLATLPIAVMIIAAALSTVPAALLMQRIGRRYGFLIGLTSAIVGMLINVGSVLYSHFLLQLIGNVFIGASHAFVQQYRFAAIETVDDPQDAGFAVSLLMLGGVVAAFLGPEMVIWGEKLLPQLDHFAAAYLLMAILLVAAMVIMSLYRDRTIKISEAQGESRPLSVIARQPVFIVAALSAAVGFGLMSFIMTGTPISMHEQVGHSLENTKWVIQSHIVAMFLPSLFTGSLIKMFGVRQVLLAGVACYLLVVVLGLAGQEVLHYWWTLVLLGVGWNFLFVGGTTLLPQSYTEAEKFRVQALNDFLVIGLQALASLLAGYIIYQFSWSIMIWTALPITTLLLILIIWMLATPRPQVA